MRLVALLLACLAACVQAHSCAMLAKVPFRVRAVREHDNRWTADIFFTYWAPGLTFSLNWAHATNLLQANHADVREMRVHGANLRLQETGPDDGEPRVMIHGVQRLTSLPNAALADMLPLRACLRKRAAARASLLAGARPSRAGAAK